MNTTTSSKSPLTAFDVRWRRYALPVDETALGEFKEVGLAAAINVTLRTTPRALRAVAEAFTMPTRWAWDAPDRFVVRSLKHLRREYLIRVF